MYILYNYNKMNACFHICIRNFLCWNENVWVYNVWIKIQSRSWQWGFAYTHNQGILIVCIYCFFMEMKRNRLKNVESFEASYDLIHWNWSWMFNKSYFSIFKIYKKNHFQILCYVTREFHAWILLSEKYIYARTKNITSE